MRCPICKKPVPHDDAGRTPAHFPFCSDRCKLIDLGRWLDGRYQVPVVEEDESDAAPARRSSVQSGAPLFPSPGTPGEG